MKPVKFEATIKVGSFKVKAGQDTESLVMGTISLEGLAASMPLDQLVKMSRGMVKVTLESVQLGLEAPPKASQEDPPVPPVSAAAVEDADLIGMLDS